MNKLTERLVVGGAALAIGLLLGWMVRGVLTYNSNLETVSTYEDWRVACPPATVKDQPCQMAEEVLDTKTQSQVARIGITREAGKPVLGFTLPFGVALEPGIGLVIGTDPVKVFPYRTCNTVGCLVVVPLDAALTASFSTAKDARILIAGLDGKPVAIPLSLKGYDAASRAYRSADAKRSSWFWRLWS